MSGEVAVEAAVGPVELTSSKQAQLEPTAA